MKWLVHKIDSSPTLNRLLSGISTWLAIQRGLPMLVGTILVAFSCLVFGVTLPLLVSATDSDTLWVLLCLPLFLLHLGILLAFIGFMMAAPLGKGYRE